MTFEDIEEINKSGFTGFMMIGDLFQDSSMLPSIKGVYMVLNIDNKKPEFLTLGTGGHFKLKDPNVSISELKNNWVDNSIVVYIGKAGKNGGTATLKSRLKQYLDFGQGKKRGHWGGRLIWQLKNSSDLVVCWKTLPGEDPRTYEAELIQQFVTKFGKRPFANLAG